MPASMSFIMVEEILGLLHLGALSERLNEGSLAFISACSVKFNCPLHF